METMPPVLKLPEELAGLNENICRAPTTPISGELHTAHAPFLRGLAC